MTTQKLIDKAIGFIQTNPKENLSLQSIAENAGFSLNYFDSLFKGATGYSPVEYSRIYKLTRSALELRRTQKSIIDIALDFGYSSPESYTRAFKSFYGISPQGYRNKYAKEGITWHELSGKISISRFKKSFPMLKSSDIDTALDFCFTHNPLKYAEDIIGMTVAESEILTLGDPMSLEHFVYVSDYNSPTPAVMLLCEKERDALSYLKLFETAENPRLSVRQPIDEEWIQFQKATEDLGLTCRYGYDMIYAYDAVIIPCYEKLSARMLTSSDLPLIKDFKQKGGCAECHVKAVQTHFDGKGNAGMKPMGVFENEKLICLAMPTLDSVRELKKYDIGAIFTLKGQYEENAADLMWKYAIDHCLKNNAAIGNANAFEDNSPLGVDICQKHGLIKIAKNCGYFKKD